MKIKTVYVPLRDTADHPAVFDDQVNDLLAEGWMLGTRKIVEAQAGASIDVLYAELVLLDPEPEPEPFDPLDLLRQVKEFCRGVDVCINCPLADWCQQLRKGGDPTDWDLPAPEVLTL